MTAALRLGGVGNERTISGLAAQPEVTPALVALAFERWKAPGLVAHRLGDARERAALAIELRGRMNSDARATQHARRKAEDLELAAKLAAEEAELAACCSAWKDLPADRQSKLLQDAWASAPHIVRQTLKHPPADPWASRLFAGQLRRAMQGTRNEPTGNGTPVKHPGRDGHTKGRRMS